MLQTTKTLAPLVVRAGQSRRSYRNIGPGTHGDVLLTTKDTGGALSLHRATFEPGTGAPPHRNVYSDEIFYVLEGHFRFQIGDEVIHAGPGACLHARPGVTHAPLNVGDTVGQVLIASTPGGLEQFFEAVEERGGIPAQLSSEERQEVAALLARHGMEFGAPAPADAHVAIAPDVSGPLADLGDHRGWMRVSSAETSGALLVGTTEADLGGGVPPHIHTREDEVFYLLSGRVAFEVDGSTVEAGPDDLIFAPRRLPHAWQAVGDEPARFIIMITPGDNFESFIWKAADALAKSPASDQSLLALSAEHGLEMLPPLK